MAESRTWAGSAGSHVPMSWSTCDSIGQRQSFLGAGWALLRQILHVLKKWRERTASRRYLLTMSHRELRDIGVTPLEAMREGTKTFWHDYPPHARDQGADRRR